MTANRKAVRSRTSRLVRDILGSTELPALVKALPVRDLQRLIQHLGKEDSQELLVHASAKQINGIIEVETWTQNDSGSEETFSPDSMLEWIDLWNEQGSAYLARRLQDLGSELLALTLQHYAVVVDIQEVGISGPIEIFGCFGIMPKEEEHWSQLLPLIIEVWCEAPNFLEEALAYCCHRRTLMTEKTHIATNETLESDVAVARDSRRRRSGFVSPQNAYAFLRHIADTPVDALILEPSYDPFAIKQIHKSHCGSEGRDRKDSSPSNMSAKNYTASQILVDELLREATPSPDETYRPRLMGSAGSDDLLLNQHLELMGETSPQSLRQRQSELAYLANVLLEGAPSCLNLNERQAMRFVHHTCNLGFLYCLQIEPWDSEDEVIKELLECEPGLLKAFSVGYRLILEIRSRLFVALEEYFCSQSMRRIVDANAWFHRSLKEYSERIQQGVRLKDLSSGEFNVLLDMMLTSFDPGTCEQIRLLGDSLPRFPVALDPSHTPSLYVNKRSRFISEPRQLQIIDAFIDALEHRLSGTPS